jgi:capsular exopolysaccharide synthesis family protein
MDKPKLIVHKDPKSPASEAYRTLRTNIQFSSLDNPMKTIVITSAGPGEGKTTSVINLGTAMAQSGLKVLLIDGDLRKPQIHKTFEIFNGPGLTDVLVNGPDYREGVSSTYIAGLEILSAGTIPPNPSELLASDRMKQFLGEIRENYDFVLIDTSPAAVVTKLRNIPFSPPDITDEEINEVINAMKSGWITTGPRTKEFERKIAEYVGVNKAVCLNSATAAMELTLRILGIGPGDEVITSAYTYTASASVIDHVGAKIVLVDTAPDSFEMDYEKLADAITENTKAIIPVDIAGKMCDYDKIYEVVESKKELFKANNDIQDLFNRVIVMADAAHAFGAERKGLKCGQVADFTCFSFHAVKNLTTAEGGAVVWRNDLGLDDEEMYKQFMLYSLHGQSKDALAKTKKGAWEYDIVIPAYKCNMTDILASFGLIQIKRYEGLLERRKEIIEMYDSMLHPLGVQSLQHYGEDFASTGHLYLARIPGINEEERNEIIIKMAEDGIATNVHYKPLPMFTAYKNLGFDIKDYPNAYAQYANEITLPLHTLLSDEDVEYILYYRNDSTFRWLSYVETTCPSRRNKYSEVDICSSPEW